MVIFKLFTDIVEIGWVRVIYDGLGNFQLFSGFLWPKLRVPHCTNIFRVNHTFLLDVNALVHVEFSGPVQGKNNITKLKTYFLSCYSRLFSISIWNI